MNSSPIRRSGARCGRPTSRSISSHANALTPAMPASHGMPPRYRTKTTIGPPIRAVRMRVRSTWVLRCGMGEGLLLVRHLAEAALALAVFGQRRGDLRFVEVGPEGGRG